MKMESEPNNETVCFNFTKKELTIIYITKDVTASVSIGLCCLAILLMVFTKAYKQFVHRLTLYLTIAALGYSIVFILQTAPVHYDDKSGLVVVRKGLEGLCETAGFLHQYAGWTVIVFVCWITVYMFMLVAWKRTPRKRVYEAAGVIVSLLVPCTFNWLPFINNMYGLAGAWCWIRLTHSHCALKDFKQGLAYEFGLWYAPVIFVVALNFLVICVMLVVLCKKVRSNRVDVQAREGKQYRKAIKEILPLLFYPVFFIFVVCLAVANRVSYALTVSKGDHPFFPLWVVHAFADPARPLVIPLCFLLHPYTLKRLRCNELRRSATMWVNQGSTAPTECVIPPEGDDVDPLIVRDLHAQLGQQPRYSTFFEA